MRRSISVSQELPSNQPVHHTQATTKDTFRGFVPEGGLGESRGSEMSGSGVWTCPTVQQDWVWLAGPRHRDSGRDRPLSFSRPCGLDARDVSPESPVGPTWGLNDVAEKSNCRERRRHTNAWLPRPAVIPVPRSRQLPDISAHRDHRLCHPASCPSPADTPPSLQQTPGVTAGHGVGTGDAVVASP